MVIRWNSIREAQEGLKSLNRSNCEIGTVHTLGALHEGHSHLIMLAAKENDYVIVSIYPNVTQLSPGSIYNHDIEQDCNFAVKYGATHLITPSTDEVYPDDYCTFLNQGIQYTRLDGSVSPYLFRGMITMTLRWLILTKPTRSYFGLKDIAQVILVKRAVKDLLLDTIIREVPCVRYGSGMAISSRMMNNTKSVVEEFNRGYFALESARNLIAKGEVDSQVVLNHMMSIIDEPTLKHFKLQYVKIAKPTDFIEPEIISIPIIIQVVMKLGDRSWFEGFYIRNIQELMNGPEVIWLNQKYPDFVTEDYEK